jgi:hypothetical protein
LTVTAGREWCYGVRPDLTPTAEVIEQKGR